MIDRVPSVLPKPCRVVLLLALPDPVNPRCSQINDGAPFAAKRRTPDPAANAIAGFDDLHVEARMRTSPIEDLGGPQSGYACPDN